MEVEFLQLLLPSALPHSISICFFFCKLAQLCVDLKLPLIGKFWPILSSAQYILSLLYFSLDILVKLVLVLFFTKRISIPGRDRDPSSTYWRMKEKRTKRELKCCHLVFEIVNSNWKILTLSQTHKHMLQCLAVCFGGCVVFANLFNRSIHKIIVTFKNYFSFFLLIL